MAGGHHVEPLEGIGFFAGARLVEIVGGVGELRGKFGDKFGADFVATRADAGADCGEKVGRIRAKVRVKFTDGLFEDASKCAAPACVDSSDSAFFGVDEK